MNNYITKTSIEGLLVIERPTFSDERGFFREVARFNDLNKAIGFEFKPVQINHSMTLPHHLRGIHMESWNKLVYPVSGSMFSAIVDARPESKTFGKFETFNFSWTSHKSLFIPKGLGNSICTLGTEPVSYVYFVDAYYDGTDTKAIAWNDPDLNIEWPVENPVVSDRDENNPTLRELFPNKFK